MNKICVIGTGYVGLVTGTCFAEIGNNVVCLDVDNTRINNLNNGIMPIYEPGLQELVKQNVDAKRLIFTTNYSEALFEVEYIFIGVGTPSGINGEADLQYVKSAIKSIAKEIDHSVTIINKSTVPVGTGDMVTELMNKYLNSSIDFSVVSNPEFLREGTAISDFMNPDRVVLGSVNKEASDKVASLYAPLGCKIISTDLRTAEMIKYASNSFLATRISFINEIANICEELGANVQEVALGMGSDKRIGYAFLNAGIGWGGSCFPKDVKALEHMAVTHGTHPQLLQAVIEINKNQKHRALVRLRKELQSFEGKTIGILGLSFKPNTDDTRDAIALDIIRLLLNEGAIIKAYDPQAVVTDENLLRSINMCKNSYEVSKDADAIILATEWNEFKQLDFIKIKENMKNPLILDGRNIWDSKKLRQLGFIYLGIGKN